MQVANFHPELWRVIYNGLEITKSVSVESAGTIVQLPLESTSRCVLAYYVSLYLTKLWSKFCTFIIFFHFEGVTLFITSNKVMADVFWSGQFLCLCEFVTEKVIVRCWWHFQLDTCQTEDNVIEYWALSGSITWIPDLRVVAVVVTLYTKLSGAVYCNRSCLWVCGHVCLYVILWVCYHDNSKLCASIFTKLGL